MDKDEKRFQIHLIVISYLIVTSHCHFNKEEANFLININFGLQKEIYMNLETSIETPSVMK